MPFSGLMGCNSSKSKGIKQPAGGREYTLAILGLDNAGKTCTVRRLKGEQLGDVAPTIGFSNEEIKFANKNIVMYDLGGGHKFRDVWQRYFGEIHGLIYVVDASKHDRLEEGRGVLERLMEHPKVAQKPILILGNKQDVEGAMDEIDLVHGLGIESMANGTKSPCRVELCSTADVVFSGKKQDNQIRKGFEWLIDMINTNYDFIQKRVSKDASAQKADEERDKKEKRERVNKLREERTKQQKKSGYNSDDDRDEAEAPNPFRPINDTIKMNEDRMKREKAQLGKSSARDDVGKRSSLDRENVPPAYGSRSKDDVASSSLYGKSKTGSLSSSKDDFTRDKLSSNDDNYSRSGLSSLNGRKPLPLEDSKSSKKPKKNQTSPYGGDSAGSQSSLNNLKLGSTLRASDGDRLARSGSLQRANQPPSYPSSSSRTSAGNSYNKKLSRGSDDDNDNDRVTSSSWRRKPNYDDDDIEM